MPKLILTDINPDVLDQLTERAKSHGRTPQDEAKEILLEAFVVNGRKDWSDVDRIYNRLSATGQVFSDSAQPLREDRGR